MNFFSKMTTGVVILFQLFCASRDEIRITEFSDTMPEDVVPAGPEMTEEVCEFTRSYRPQFREALAEALSGLAVMIATGMTAEEFLWSMFSGRREHSVAS